MGQKKSSIVSKITLSLGLIFASTVYAAWQRISGETSPALETSRAQITPGQSYKAANDALLKTLAEIEAAAKKAAEPAPIIAINPDPSVTIPATTPAPTPAPKPAGRYTDGSYTGDAIDAYYGTVQVRATVRSGLVTDVQFLQHPDTRSTSRFINDQAMPLLTQEAIQAQSAQVDGVSGATFTSEAFRQSLTSALAQAS